MFFDNVHILLWMYKLCVLNMHKSKYETRLLPEKLYSHLSQHKDLKTPKGKAIPLQAWSGPEGSRKLWFPDFMTTA